MPQQATESPFNDHELLRYLSSEGTRPLLIQGDALEVLKAFPDESIDCCMTSPPYWGQRQYVVTGIGLEADYRDYISNLARLFLEVKRVLKSTRQHCGLTSVIHIKTNSFWGFPGASPLNLPINKAGFSETMLSGIK